MLVAFRELYVLLAGLVRCLKTCLWSALLIFLALNVWSLLSVEYLHPEIVELDAMNVYESCKGCSTAFKDVLRANLTWFRIISGDGWGDLMLPLIETYYWPILLLASNIFLVSFGLVNL